MFDISKLKNNIVQTLEINETFEFKEEQLKNTDIKRLENIKATGNISRINSDVYHLTLNITGNMFLLCARSLEEVSYPLDIFINQNISSTGGLEENQVIFENTLDIFGIVWENIVLEVPLRVIKEDASFLTEGEGWSLNENNKTNNSPLSGLLDILEMEEKE